MRKFNFLFLFLIGLLAFNLSSCAIAPTPYTSLDKTIKAYERAIRWRDFNFARALHIKSEEVSDFTRLRLKNIRVTSYKTINKVIAPDLSKAEIIVDIRYYYDNSVVERVLTDRQMWLYDEKVDRWQLDSPFPNFKFH